jgi:phage-related tail fiber protein
MIQVQPSGMVAHFANSAPPEGWLKCNGAAISRTTFSDLFEAIGTAYGAGNGSTTFNVPDLRGEFIRGWDDGRGADPSRGFGNAQGHAFGSHAHSASTNTVGNHVHSQVGVNELQQFTQGGAGWASGATANTGGAGSHSHSVSVDAAGSSETRPRNVSLLACIKY